MAINIINSQGTQVYVAPEGTDVSDCAKTLTALGTAKLVGCPQSIGDLAETREVTEYACLSSDETAKALGSIKRGNIQLELLLDPTDTAGQAELKTAFANNDNVIIIIELSDKGSTNGTMFTFTASVSEVSTGIAQNEAVKYTVTLEIASAIVECPAA